MADVGCMHIMNNKLTNIIFIEISKKEEESLHLRRRNTQEFIFAGEGACIKIERLYIMY
jgi:hypothetical protein